MIKKVSVDQEKRLFRESQSIKQSRRGREIVVLEPGFHVVLERERERDTPSSEQQTHMRQVIVNL
jgi:hypothetical protein